MPEKINPVTNLYYHFKKKYAIINLPYNIGNLSFGGVMS